MVCLCRYGSTKDLFTSNASCKIYILLRLETVMYGGNLLQISIDIEMEILIDRWTDICKDTKISSRLRRMFWKDNTKRDLKFANSHISFLVAKRPLKITLYVCTSLTSFVRYEIFCSCIWTEAFKCCNKRDICLAQSRGYQR